MDLLKSKRKIKALTILEKLNRYNRNEVLGRYRTSVDLISKLGSTGEVMSERLVLAEREIERSMLEQSQISVETLVMKYAYAENLNFLLQKNKKDLDEESALCEEIKKHLIAADARTNLAEDKRRQEVLIYQNGISERCEA